MGHEFHEPLGYIQQQSWKAKLIIKEMAQVFQKEAIIQMGLQRGWGILSAV